MRLTKQSEYGLMGLAVLVEAGEGAIMPTGEIAERIGVSPRLLTVAFHRLARAGLVEARRGPGGGCRLARSAAQVTLADVVRAVEGRAALDECPIWSGHRCANRPCPLHARMLGPVTRIRSMIRSTSLANYVDRLGDSGPQATRWARRDRPKQR